MLLKTEDFRLVDVVCLLVPLHGSPDDLDKRERDLGVPLVGRLQKHKHNVSFVVTMLFRRGVQIVLFRGLCYLEDKVIERFTYLVVLTVVGVCVGRC